METAFPSNAASGAEGDTHNRSENASAVGIVSNAHWLPTSLIHFVLVATSLQYYKVHHFGSSIVYHVLLAIRAHAFLKRYSMSECVFDAATKTINLNIWVTTVSNNFNAELML